MATIPCKFSPLEMRGVWFVMYQDNLDAPVYPACKLMRLFNTRSHARQMAMLFNEALGRQERERQIAAEKPPPLSPPALESDEYGLLMEGQQELVVTRDDLPEPYESPENPPDLPDFDETQDIDLTDPTTRYKLREAAAALSTETNAVRHGLGQLGVQPIGPKTVDVEEEIDESQPVSHP